MGGLVVSDLAIKNKLAGVVLIGPVAPNPLAAEVFSRRIETVKQGKKISTYMQGSLEGAD